MNIKTIMLAATVFAGLAAFAADAKEQAKVENWLMQTNGIEKLVQKTDGKLPDVFIVGDSISLGYTPVVQKLMKDKANVTRPPTNCGSSYHYIMPTKKTGDKMPMETWVGDKHYNVIVVNFGIWDNHYNAGPKNGVSLWSIKGAIKKLQTAGKATTPEYLSLDAHARHKIRTPINEYEANLRKILPYLKEHADKVLFCLTTPVPEWLACDGFGRVRVYNEMAEAVCAELGVGVIDLYTVAEQNYDKYSHDGVHFQAAGYKLLAEEVVKGIEAALKK